MKWGNETFRQADKVSDEFSLSMTPFIKSNVVYDQFVSIADFSAIFLTDKARMIQLDYYFHRNFKTPEEQEIARQRLLIENDHYITFYIVGYQPNVIYPSGRSLFSGEYQIQGPLLGSPDANWKLSMLVDGVEYAPSDIRPIELPIEYQTFLGVHYSQFKSSYRVRFDCRDHQNKEILTLGHHYIVLKFNSVMYTTSIEWRDIVYRFNDSD